MNHFSSDPHFYHANSIDFCKRPFKSVEHMNAQLIENYNSVVKSGDNLYILGDFCFSNLENTTEILKQLNGNIHLVAGNHDGHILKNRNYYINNGLFASISLQRELYMENGTKVCMSHYPMMSWNRQRHGSVMLHGHCHGSMRYPSKAFIYDVGVDPQHYFPVSEETIMAFVERDNDEVRANNFGMLDWH